MKHTKFYLAFLILNLFFLPALCHAQNPIAFDIFQIVQRQDSMADIYEDEEKIGSILITPENAAFFGREAQNLDWLGTAEQRLLFPGFSLIKGKSYILRPVFGSNLSQKYGLISIIIYGKLLNTSQNQSWLDQTIEMGRLDITEHNAEFFNDLPLEGQIITFSDHTMSVIYAGATYTTQYQLTHGKSYGIVPVFCGDTHQDIMRRINLRGTLSVLND